MKFANQVEIMDNFSLLLNSIECPKLRKVCEELREYKDFWTHPASIGHHHDFEGGLVVHTFEVIEFATHMSKLFADSSDDIIVTAGLWHDLAKIYEYSKTADGFWIKNDYHGKVHHISGSTAEFTAIAMKHDISREMIQKVQHCIISHHGTKEWGSPRKPESLEAIILHQSDMLSAMYPIHTTPIQ